MTIPLNLSIPSELLSRKAISANLETHPINRTDKLWAMWKQKSVVVALSLFRTPQSHPCCHHHHSLHCHCRCLPATLFVVVAVPCPSSLSPLPSLLPPLPWPFLLPSTLVTIAIPIAALTMALFVACLVGNSNFWFQFLGPLL
jgi:hypothetical protein